MDLVELAHWRYRTKAIAVDLAESRQIRGQVGVLYQFLPEAEAIEQAAKVDAEYQFLRFLLEEAKYMTELGELTLT